MATFVVAHGAWQAGWAWKKMRPLLRDRGHELITPTYTGLGERARAFKGISPGMLPPLGIIFGLLVAFLASQAWSDLDKAHTAVHHEASALRAVVLLIASFPGEPEVRARALMRHHVQEAATQEWPAIRRLR